MGERSWRSIRSTLVLVTIALLSLSAWSAEFRSYEPPVSVELKLEDVDGSPHTLADYRGQVVLVNFWATWCPPCIAEMPALERLRHRLAPLGFEILAVNMGEQEQPIRNFMGKIPTSFPILLDVKGKAARDWTVFALPTTFLVNAEGLVTHELTGTTDWDESAATNIIESALQEPGGGD